MTATIASVISRSARADPGGALVARSLATFAELRAARLATSNKVVQVIFGAATDGTDQLRYVATQDILPLVVARRETSEKEYVALMRSQLGFRP